MPRTKIVVLAPNPSRLGISALLLQAYRPVLRARGVELSLCGARAGGCCQRLSQAAARRGLLVRRLLLPTRPLQART